MSSLSTISERRVAPSGPSSLALSLPHCTMRLSAHQVRVSSHIRLENERVIVDFTNEDRAHLFPSLASRTSKMPTRPSLGCARNQKIGASANASPPCARPRCIASKAVLARRNGSSITSVSSSGRERMGKSEDANLLEKALPGADAAQRRKRAERVQHDGRRRSGHGERWAGNQQCRC